MSLVRALAGAIVVIVITLAGGCEEPPPPNESYYDREIAPLLELGCASQTTGCHLATPEGTAAGNLDLTSYDSLMRRRDALPAYGPYPVGLLLLKAGDPVEVPVDTLDGPVTIRTDIRHNAGSGISLAASTYAELVRWINDGFPRNGVPVERARANDGDCVPGAGAAAGFDPAAVPDAASFDRFVNDVQPVLRARCAGSACHGAALADLHLACGDDEAERRWNYWIATSHLADPVDRSELLRRPLAVGRGGAFHGGGDTFATPDDAGFIAIRDWAEELVSRNPAAVAEDTSDPGYRFFVNRVQPVLVRKGCTALNCHSPISLKMNLRGGSGGSFSRYARLRNYSIARKLLAIDSPFANESRLVAKNLFPPEMTPGGQGIAHRGGSLLEDFGPDDPASPDDCDGIDADTADLNEIPAYCVIARWHAIERAESIAEGEILPDDAMVRAVVWVARPLGVGDVTDFDTYRPGADLRIADATFDATGAITLGDPRSALAACRLDVATADVRGPAASWDGSRIAFAARSSAAEPLRLWEMSADGTDCAPIPDVAAAVDQENGILTHDFDPAWAPDGSLVFASTRGNLDRAGYDYGYAGPTRTPAQMQPNANLYARSPGGELRQLTFLLDQELAPAFMMDGRVIFTAEKRAEGLHQLALRRQNLDGGDYHPLYAQRPSLGFGAATEVVQLPNLNFAFVASEPGLPDGAGTIAVFNRSIGPDQEDRAPGDRPYLRSMTIPVPGLLGGLDGVFRSPAALPTGRILASCDADAVVMSEGFDFDLCELDPHSGAVRPIGGVPGLADVEVTVAYARQDRGILVSDGSGIDSPEIVPGARDAEVHFNDFPMIASLMFENTREGRPIDPRIAGFDVIEVLPPPIGATGFDELASSAITDEHGPMWQSHRVLGHVPLFADGSTRMRLPGGVPIRFQLTDADGAPLAFEDEAAFDGLMIQREQEQYYPGERIQRSIPRRFFNAVCGGCHGSISGRELDIAVDLDVISGASQNAARDAEPHDLLR